MICGLKGVPPLAMAAVAMGLSDQWHIAFETWNIPQGPRRTPSATVGLRWTSDSGRDDIYLVANSINSGVWGYDNLQWLGGTYYHKFNEMCESVASSRFLTLRHS
jgi:hypothetical protein